MYTQSTINKECKCTHKVLLIKNVNVHTNYVGYSISWNTLYIYD